MFPKKVIKAVIASSRSSRMKQSQGLSLFEKAGLPRYFAPHNDTHSGFLPVLSALLSNFNDKIFLF